ncbi:MAG: PASTA domain-containing protein [Clostridia bacterium]|nr:PASTA domain-containing protein [Clostridia bacterium]
MRMTVEQANREYASLLRGLTLDRELGRSSYSVVYAATDTDGSECRIKIIRLPGSEDDLAALRENGCSEEEIRARLESAMREVVGQIDRLRRLTVPSVMVIEDRRLVRGSSGELVLLVRCEPLTLFDDFARTHDITANDLLNLGIAVCRALGAAAEEGIVHGNLKPSNLFVAADGTVCLADFAEERLLGQALDTVPFDSLLYMPPELQEESTVSSDADLYALGMVLYSLFNNRCAPFLASPNADEAALRRAIVLRNEADELPPPVNADDEVALILARACSFDPSRRYTDPAAFADDLRDCLLDEKDDYVVIPAIGTITEILPLSSGEAPLPAPSAEIPQQSAAFVPPTANPTYAGAAIGAYASAAAYRSNNDAAIRAAQQYAAVPQPGQDIPQQPYPAAAEENDLNLAADAAMLSDIAAPEDGNDDYPPEEESSNMRRLIPVLAAILALLLLFAGVVWGISRLTSIGNPDETEDPSPSSTVNPSDTLTDPIESDPIDPETSTADPSVTVSPDDTTTQSPETTQAPETTAQTPIINETTAPPAAEVKLPKLTGLDYTEAAAKLRELKLHTVTTEVYSDTVAQGKVISQSVAEGTTITEGTTISLTVSLGAETFSVPVLVGLTQEEAEAKLAELSLKADISTRFDSADVGTVLTQDPAVGAKLPAGGSVKLIVSAGPEILSMPNFTGKTRTQAEELIRRHNLTNVLWQSAPSSVYAKDSIYYQSIPVGNNIETDSPITLYISLGAENLSLPNVIGMAPDAAIAILQGCGYTVIPVYEAAAVEQVLSTSPEAGTPLSAGTWVKVIIGDPDGEVALSLHQNTFTLDLGQSVSLGVTGVQDRALTYTSSNTKVATVDDKGQITAHAAGVAVITVTAADGETVSCYVTVSAVNPLFSYSITDGACTITGYLGNAANVTVPDRIDGTPVTAIGASAFAGKSIATISLPATITSIGNSAFENCTHLYSVNLPTSLQTIGSRAFAGCSVLSRISLPAGVVSVGNSAFERCYMLEAVYLPATVTTIGDRAFRYCPSITLYVPSNSPAMTYADEADINYTIIN